MTRIDLIGTQVYKETAERVMAQIDAMPLEWRLLVHEYGYNPVRKARALGHSPSRFERDRRLTLRRADTDKFLETITLSL